MSDTIIREWYFGCYAVLTGAIFAWGYDNLRLCRRLIHHNRVMVNLEDLLYFVYCGFQTFDMLYVYQNGTIRFYAIGAVGLGMILYERIVGRKLRNYLKKICKSLRMK